MDLASGFARMQSLPPPPPSTIAPTLPRAAPSITTPAAAAPELQSCDTAAAAGLDASPTTGGRLLLPEEMDMGEVYEAGRGNVFREVEMRRSASSLRAAATAAAAAGKGSVVGSMVSKEGGGEEEGGGVGVVVGVEGGGVGDGKGVSQGEAGEEEHYSVLVYTKPSGRQVAIMVEIGMYFVATAALLALVVVAVQQ